MRGRPGQSPTEGCDMDIDVRHVDMCQPKPLSSQVHIFCDVLHSQQHMRIHWQSLCRGHPPLTWGPQVCWRLLEDFSQDDAEGMGHELPHKQRYCIHDRSLVISWCP